VHYRSFIGNNSLLNDQFLLGIPKNTKFCMHNYFVKVVDACVS